MCTRRNAFTLIELLTSIGIAIILMAILFPALNAAREASRNSACKNNLREIGVGLQSHASLNKRYCTGGFDWARDGCVTEVGWVADLVNTGTIVGKMLCPSNTAEVSETYVDLLAGDPAGVTCPDIDMLGSEPRTAPDGQPILNPCREIAGLVESAVSAGSSIVTEQRRLIVEEKIYNKFYNTNYTASWYLVRMGPALDSSGNLKSASGCDASPTALISTEGPLEQSKVDLLAAPASLLPMMGCGAAAEGKLMPQAVGEVKQSTPVAKSITDGPVLVADMSTPVFPIGTPRNGPSGWWKVWARDTLQDYRGFAPVHRGVCNLLFADGSVRSIKDENGEGHLNNGFDPASGGGFTDSNVEMPDTEVFSSWSLQGSE